MKKVRTILATIAIMGMPIAAFSAENTYTITRLGTVSSTYYTVDINGVASSLGNRIAIQDVIENIRKHANSEACTIQFNIEMSTQYDKITFVNSATERWGKITLTGTASINNIRLESDIVVECKATLSTASSILFSNESNGTLTIINGSSLRSNSEVIVNNTGTVNISGGTVSAGRSAVSNNTGTINISGGTIVGRLYADNVVENYAGTINISGGTIDATIASGAAVNNSGTVNVSGGSILNDLGRAILNLPTGVVNISGGTVSAWRGQSVNNNGTLTINGGTVSTGSGTAVYNYGTVTINGGMVSAANQRDAPPGDAIINFTVYNSIAMVNINGGTVSATTGMAVNNKDGKTVNISGGFVFAYGTTITGTEMNNNYVIKGTHTIGGTAVVCAWNRTNQLTYPNGSSTDLTVNPAGASATWGKRGVESGINYTNGTNAGFFPIDNVTISIVAPTYRVTVNNGTGSGEYEAGDIVSIAADVPVGHKFKNWSSSSVGVSFANANSANTTFPMPANAVTVTATFEDATGIDAITANHITIFPNPTCDVLNFSLETNYKIINLQGHIMLKNDRVVKSVNIRSLPPGVYFVVISTETGEIVKKIVKQ